MFKYLLNSLHFQSIYLSIYLSCFFACYACPASCRVYYMMNHQLQMNAGGPPQLNTHLLILMRMLFIFRITSNQIFKQFGKVCDFLTQLTVQWLILSHSVRVREEVCEEVQPFSTLSAYIESMNISRST